MPATCTRCGRPKDNSRDEKTGIRKRNSEHQCNMAVVRATTVSPRTDVPVVKQVHEARIEKGGDLYKKTRGKKPEWEVVYRPTTVIEKLADRQGRKRKRGSTKKLKAPTGKRLEPPK